MAPESCKAAGGGRWSPQKSTQSQANGRSLIQQRVCRAFREGFRVEYKSELNNDVRDKLPKVVSSFANSLGGALVIGVNTDSGVPREPIEGFNRPRGDELPLTVQNICLYGINPPVLPTVTEVESDIPGRVFLVIEVEESWEAPHAIENSKKAYVRTGDAATPWDLAAVDVIIELTRRRARPEELRERLLKQARARGMPPERVHPEVFLVPPYPRRSLCSSEDVWTLLAETRYRGAHFLPV